MKFSVILYSLILKSKSYSVFFPPIIQNVSVSLNVIYMQPEGWILSPLIN